MATAYPVDRSRLVKLTVPFHDIGCRQARSLAGRQGRSFAQRRPSSGGPCHTNLDRRGAGCERPPELQAAVAARNVRKASSLRTRSVRRDVRWRWTLKVFWTTA
jgi:hypothetical protein